MATLFIGYDLNRPEQSYPQLIDAIKESSTAWWHNLDSTWLVKASMTPVQMRDHLRRFIDANDELLVIDVTSRTAAWTGFTENASIWIKDHL